MGPIEAVLGLACVGVLGLIWLWPAAWAIGDAQKRGVSAALPIAMFWLAGPFAALIWLAIRPAKAVDQKLPVDYRNADDALAAASQLDHLGEWDAAVSLYNHVALRWPEHAVYVENCVQKIRQKQAAD
ncbi:MAG: hypothetical protein KDA41_01960 [Planctomycetales bacterium]|nr:hypothetical protein [Planctomycetales bacterium]